MAEGRPTEDAIRVVQHVFFRKINLPLENTKMENKNRTTYILGTTSVEIKSFQVYGSGDTKKFEQLLSVRKFSKRSGKALVTKNESTDGPDGGFLLSKVGCGS